MRRTSLLVAVVFAMAAGAGAAENRVGILGGLNLATQKFRPSEDGFSLGTRTTGGAGVMLAFDLGGPFSLRLEPSFLAKGATLDISADDFLFPEAVSADLRLSYVEVPVLIQVSPRGGRVRPYLLLGMSAGQLVEASITGRATGGEEVDEDIEDGFRRADLSAILGAGLQVAADERTRVFLEGRYALGLLNVVKDPDDVESIKNRGIQILAGVSWRLGP